MVDPAPAPRAVASRSPIWRDPWMVVGSPTYTDDLLDPGRAAATCCADREGRYPRSPPREIDAAGADVVLLPDEPYVFTADDGPEAFAHPDAAGVGAVADLVRPGDGRGARRADADLAGG